MMISSSSRTTTSIVLRSLKMDNLTLAYNFGRLFGRTSLRASATVQNVFTLSPYKGIDPERAIDFSLYPIPRTYSLNLSLTL